MKKSDNLIMKICPIFWKRDRLWGFQVGEACISTTPYFSSSILGNESHMFRDTKYKNRIFSEMLCYWSFEKEKLWLVSEVVLSLLALYFNTVRINKSKSTWDTSDEIMNRIRSVWLCFQHFRSTGLDPQSGLKLIIAMSNFWCPAVQWNPHLDLGTCTKHGES